MFKITIEETKTVTRVKSGDYTIIGEETPPGKTEPKPKYGYPPKREVEEIETTEIYTQEVSEIDLPAVIRAVNKMG